MKIADFGSPCKEKWTRFAAAKPQRLQQSTGLLLRAAFRVQQGETVFEAAALFCNKKRTEKSQSSWLPLLDSNQRHTD